MEILFWILAFAFAITIHEASHAWLANRLGDPTPKLKGRISLNPLSHYDPVGTTLLLVLALLRAFTGNPAIIPFGWAKPVPVDPFNFKDPRRDGALVSLAGPASNLILAVLISFFFRIISPSTVSYHFVFPFIILNVSLAVFNLIPVHPLDGGKILIGLLPEKDAPKVDFFLSRFGTIILFFFIFPVFGGFSPISAIVTPVVNLILKILLPASQIV